jgi:nitrate/nitrite transport system ATP-binding protein
MHRHPAYYPLRNHIMDFLISRSRTFAADIAGKAYDPRNPPVVKPGIPEPQVATATPKDGGEVRRSGLTTV